MKIQRRLIPAALFALVTGGSVSVSATPQEPGATSAPRLRRLAASADGALRIDLPAVQRTAATAELAAPPKPGTPLAVGWVRDVGAETIRGDALEWQAARAGGRVATILVSSPGARGVRVALGFESMPERAQLRFFDPSATQVEGPHRPRSMRDRDGASSDPYWSPVIHGEVIGIEVWIPDDAAADSVRLSIPQLSHLDRAVTEGKDLADLDRSQACERDVACDPKYATLANAVAKIVYNSDGFTFLCSGTLVADTKTKNVKPWFLTAAHCISSAAEANSATFFWFFQRAACNGANPTTVTQTAGGAQLKFTTGPSVVGTSTTDHTLLKLRAKPPAGVSYAGWSVAAAETHVNRAVQSIHHPAGDVKKSTPGRTTDLVTWTILPTGLAITDQAVNTHYELVWNEGTTEGGSSGSGIFRGNRWPRQRFIGLLTGGAASCRNQQAPDYYGRFDLTYEQNAKVRRLLDRAGIGAADGETT